MPGISAGLLLFRRTRGRAVEVLLGHPGGPFWTGKDDGAWSIPKGELAPDEDPLAGAFREFREETGFTPAGTPIPLPPVRQPGGKLVHAWALEHDLDPAGFTSNTFELEWPPRSGRRATFPEIDRLEWFDLARARRKLLKGQLPLLDHLSAAIADPTA